LINILMKALLMAVLLFVPLSVAAHSPVEFLDLIDETRKSVVLIHNTPIPGAIVNVPSIQPPENPNEDDPKEEGDPQPPGLFTGTGFFVEGGYIVTNQHVIANSSKLEVYFEGNFKPHIALLVGEDAAADIAVLKLADESLARTITPLDWRVDLLRVGAEVWAIGHPGGLNYSVSKGIISHLDRRLASPWQPTIQTDAAVNKGNSGGPLIDMDGNVVGVNVMIYSRVSEFNGIALAVDGFTAKTIAERLIVEGEIVRPLMGVVLGYDDSAFRVKAMELTPGGAADIGGILADDLYVSIDGTEIININDVFDILADKRPGDTIKVKVLRERNTVTVKVKLGTASTQK
jgi:serine protease Do